MNKKFDYNLLTIFLEVYQHRSITLASAALGLTQPGVSGALKRLQQELGAELFVREGRGISPTNVAIQLANQIEPAFVQVNSALGNVTGFDIHIPRTFTLYVNEAIMHILQPLVEQSQTMGNCSIEFQVTPHTEDELLYKLSLQQADLAIDLGQPNHFSYFSKTFFSEKLQVVCRKSHPQIHGFINKEKYYLAKHITLKLRRGELYAADYFSVEVLRERQISCECESILSMMALVSQSDGIGVVTTSMAEKYAKKFDLQVLEFPFEEKPIIHKMMWHKRNQHHPAQKWLRNKLEELVKNSSE